MSSSQSPPNSEHPNEPGPGYVLPPEGGNSSPPPPPPPPITSTSYPEDPTRNKIKSFSDKSVRLSFIRKVYSLLTCQLLLTFGIVAFISFHPSTKLFIQSNQSLFFIALGVAFVTLIIICCCSSVARKTPMNFICLLIFAADKGFFVGLLSTYRYKYEILLIFGITIVLCFCLTLFAFQTKFKYTGLKTVLLVCAIGLLICVILTICFLPYINLIIFSTLGAILFSFFFLCMTQLMIEGKHTYSISPDEYVFATLNLYIAVIHIFCNGDSRSRG